MSLGSPTAYLLWAILACIFFTFLFFHLWAYDRFKCLRWDSGRQPGAFKRVMTYSYLGTLPMLVVFSVAMTTIKFKEGYVVTPTGNILPRPFSLWQPANKNWILPLYFVLSIGWSLELVTHLEELAFWLFLLHQGPGKREWFHSWEYRTWSFGSIIAVLGMPLTTLVTRRQLETCQAWIFLAGSSAGTSTTICFLYVLFRFPGFINHVKAGGAEPDVVVRLATFYQLNRIRVMFRFLFTVPLLLIAVDSIRGPYPIVSDPFAFDFLLMMGGIGCFISSAITLMIFFPRSITREWGYKAKLHSPQNSAKPPTVTSPLPDYYQHDQDTSSPKLVFSHTSPNSTVGVRMNAFRFPDETPVTHSLHALHPSQPSRRRDSTESETSPGYETDAESIAMDHPSMSLHFPSSGVPVEGDPSNPVSGVREENGILWEHPEDSTSRANTRRHSDGPFVYNRHGKIVSSEPSIARSHRGIQREIPSTSQLHPYVINFTSPIDLLDGTTSDDGHLRHGPGVV